MIDTEKNKETLFYTVNRLMSLADEYRDGYNPLMTDIARQALEAELRKLLTPLSEEQMWHLWNAQGHDAMGQVSATSFAREIEAAHGITLHSDKSSFSGGAE